MKILIIDGMGGGIGKSIIEQIKNEFSNAEIIAIGTNSISTAAMIKAGASFGATGENAVVINSTKVDYIIGAIGIVFANAMYGEITPKMAEAISSSSAHKILLPIDKCNVTVMGVTGKPIHSHISEIANKIKEKMAE